MGYQGGQGRFGVTPDITIYGKAIAGGLPLGAIAGKASIMRLFASENDGASVFSGSTYGGNPTSVAAGIATLSYLRDHGDKLYAALNTRADTLATRLNTYWKGAGLPISIDCIGSILKLSFDARTKASPNRVLMTDAKDAFFVHLLDRGVAVHASGVMFLSMAHSDDDINFVGDAFVEASEQTAADGLF